MLATLERIELLDKVDELSQMILQSDLLETYYDCLNRLYEDREALSLLREFAKKKELYEDVQRFGKYHPDFTEITTSIRDLKREVDLNETIAAFKKAEDDIQKLLDEISVFIGHSVSKNVKVPTGNPFFDSLSGCGGGCGSGGSCGCS
jgi:cell fate (sporulation/competence/biofilm development) regulator YlbF (YheA/YmcA/DUF963 family)